MKISIIGAGYVGLVTAACFSEVGHSVLCIDNNKKKIRNLKKNKIDFFEPSLNSIIRNSILKKNLVFHDEIDKKINDVEIIFVCVGTPESNNGKADLSQIKSVVNRLAKFVTSKKIIFFKSTVPPNTCSKMHKLFKNSNSYDVEFASNPEFLREGQAVSDFKKPDRIVIGTDSDFVKQVSNDIYKPFNWSKSRMLFTDAVTSELIKYASNSFLATKISFMNELSRLSSKLNTNIHDVRLGMGLDKRIGEDFLYSGIGYGGSCFPKDISALLNSFKSNKLKSEILTATKKVNDTQIDFFKDQIFKNVINSKRKDILFWGLSFKGGTDDIRSSMALKLLKEIHQNFKKVYVYDPIVSEISLRQELSSKKIHFIEELFPQKKIKDSNIRYLVIASDSQEFRAPDLDKLRDIGVEIIFDGRNILNVEDVKNYKFKYFGIGIQS